MATLQPSWPGSTRVLVVTGGLVALLVWQHLSLGSTLGLVALDSWQCSWFGSARADKSSVANCGGERAPPGLPHSPSDLQDFESGHNNQTKALLNPMQPKCNYQQDKALKEGTKVLLFLTLNNEIYRLLTGKLHRQNTFILFWSLAGIVV